MTNPQNVRAAAKVNDVGTLRVDQYLTNFSVAYRVAQDQFIARRASTEVPVLNESDKFTVFPRGYFLRDEAEVRPLGGRPVQVGYKVRDDHYMAEEWALEHTIDDRQRRNSGNPIDLDESGVMLLEGKQLIREDRLWAQKFFKTGVWSTDVDLAANDSPFAPFDDAASDPVATIDAQRAGFLRRTGFRANTLVLGVNVKTALRTNASMVDRVKYTQTGIMTDALLAALFEVQNVIEAGSVYNAANEGADDDIEFIADPDAFWLGYVEPTARMGAPTAIARFAWTGLLPGTNRLGGVITRGRDDRAYSDWIHSRNAFDLKLVASDLGVFYTNVTNNA
jgi:hypothetical protein